jgi:hypothetical protein
MIGNRESGYVPILNKDYVTDSLPGDPPPVRLQKSLRPLDRLRPEASPFKPSPRLAEFRLSAAGHVPNALKAQGDSFADVGQCFLAGRTLANATRNRGTFCDPDPVLIAV